jgi:hypothetical protein
MNSLYSTDGSAGRKATSAKSNHYRKDSNRD